MLNRLTHFFKSLTTMTNKTDTWQHWNAIKQKETLKQIIEKSEREPQLIFKYSTRCSVSILVEERLEELEERLGAEEHQVGLHMVNVIDDRDISQFIADQVGVRHESPQVLLLENGAVTWHRSHMAIQVDDIVEALNS